MGRATLVSFVTVAALGCSWEASPPIDVSDVKQVHDFLANPPDDKALRRWDCVPRMVSESEGKKYGNLAKKVSEYEKTRCYVHSVGERAYPTYESILSDPNSNPRAVAAVIRLITDDAVKHSRYRNRFRQLAAARLTDQDCAVQRDALDLLGKIGGPEEASLAAAFLRHEDSGVVLAAVEALGKIGGPEEAPLVATCLYHRDNSVIRAAAEALIDIGGPKELAVMAEWQARIKALPSDTLNHNPQLWSPQLWEHVEKCCEKLRVRLGIPEDKVK